MGFVYPGVATIEYEQKTLKDLVANPENKRLAVWEYNPFSHIRKKH